MRPILFALLLLAGNAFAQEDQLIAILKSDAPLVEKADACEELARVATRKSVPVLSALLADAQLSHRARLALEPIADPSADAALRQALPQLQGPLLVGVIHSLGVRKDPQAVEHLAPFLSASDPAVAQAAARALGSIGNTAAAALDAALPAASPATLPALCEGLFRCAEALPDPKAIALYDRIQTLPNLPHHLRVAAFSGAVRRRNPREGIPLLVEALRMGSPVPAADVMRITMDFPGPEMTRALVGALGSIHEEDQVAVLQTLGYRGDASAVNALIPLAKTGPAKRRIAAIQSLVQLNQSSSIPGLVALVKDTEPSVATAAWTGLAGLPGPEADAAVVALIGDSDSKTRVAAMGAVGQRRITAAIPALIKAATDSDARVGGASFKVLGELGGVAEIPAMVNALSETQATAAGENALIALCERQPDPSQSSALLLPGLATAKGEAKLALLGALGSLGGPRALEAMRAAATDADESVRETACRALCAWPTADALPDLARLTRTSKDPAIQNLALRGQLRLIPLQASPSTVVQQVAQIQALLPLIEQQKAQPLALATLGGLPCAESLSLVLPFLSQVGFKAEASVAAVTIAERIVNRHPAEVAAAMRWVQTNDAPLAERVRQVMTKVPANHP
ncbi:MAG: HEAT repeat domain-containing protein [Verrucomicrobiales bacterium]|nr:HEAT repeat domain-containing protein [Verrucomicrobiales bacterium]